jgi:hypothetical protein
MLLVVVALVVGASASPQPPPLSRPAAALVRPILSARVAAHAAEFDADGRFRGESPHTGVFEDRFGRLLANYGRAADEALAVLMWFYLGEGPDNELACAVRKRGARMIPHLQRFLEAAPATGLEPIPSAIAIGKNQGRSALASIKAGEDPGQCE